MAEGVGEVSRRGMCFYDFDDTIPARDIYFTTHGTMDVSDYDDNFFVESFGGEKRLARLERHFDRLKSGGAELSIVSFGWSPVIREALKRVGLQGWFDEDLIFGSDSPLLIENRGVKGELIHELMASRQLDFGQTIFVDDNWDNIEFCEREEICQTLHVNHSGGMSERDMEIVEGILI